jgi:geranylgeranylglycerol-phosphate geranylgeranyltransferase
MPFDKTVLFFGLIAALVDLGEEIAADAMDMKGDMLIESNSLAIKLGKNRAIKISGFFFVIVILLSIVPFIMSWFTPIYLIPIAVMDFSIAFFFFRLLKSENEEGRKFIRGIYLGATFGLVLFLLMRILGF